MLGVDTNVLVRFLAVDDLVQTPLAARLLTEPAHHPIYLSALVLAESFTVLTKVKKYPAAEIVQAFRLMLGSPQFQIETPEMVALALDDVERTGCDLPDALIGRQNRLAGCRATATFDLRAQRLDFMTAVEAQF